MKILTLSGSAREDSANTHLLKNLVQALPEHQIVHGNIINNLPLFRAESDRAPWPATVVAWRTLVQHCDGLIIATPEYLHNLPALLKNALEWLASSGELVNKPVLPITYTPHPPRGERAMQSLCWSLQALDARILAQLPLYQQELSDHQLPEEVVAAVREVLGS